MKLEIDVEEFARKIKDGKGLSGKDMMNAELQVSFTQRELRDMV